MNNFDLENRNNIILDNISELKNNIIMQDLHSIYKEENMLSQFIKLLNIYKVANENKLSLESFEDEIKFNEYESSFGASTKLEAINNLSFYGKNSMCLLKKEFKGEIFYDNGFFFKSQKSGIPFKIGLITSYKNYLLSKDYVNFIYNGKEYQLNINDSQIFSNDFNYANLKLNNGKRKIFLNDNLNYVCIEILDIDKIYLDEKYLFELNYFELFHEQEGILSLFYTTNGDLFFSQGIIKDYLNKKTFSHTCFINDGLTCAPLLDKNNSNEIMGIYIGKIKDFNLGNTISEIVIDIKAKYSMTVNVQNTLQTNFITLRNHFDSVTNIFLLDNNTLCSCSCDGKIIIYDLSSFKELYLIEDNVKIIFHTKLSNNNIVSCCENGDIKIYGKNSSFIKIFDSNDFILLDTLDSHKQPVC